MELTTKRFLIASIILGSLGFIASCSMLIVQFIFKSINYPNIMLSYTSCDGYLQLKHESFSTKIHLVNSLFIFLEIISQSCLLGISIFEIVKKTEQTLIQIVKSVLFRVKYFLLAFSAILCVQLAGNNFNLQRENSLCQNLFQSALIIAILSLAAFIINLLFIVLLLVVNSTAKSREGPEIQVISSIDANTQMNKLLNKDTKQIRENLLNQHDLQFDGDNLMEYQRGNKFTSFQKIFETKAEDKSSKDKSNSSKKDNHEKQSQRQFEAIEEAELKFDKDRVKEIQKNSIKKFSEMGYDVIERPYLAKTILSKKFKANKKDEINDKSAKNIKGQQKQLSSSRPIVEEAKQDEFEIVINMDTAEQKTASNFYDQNDLQTIALDQIYYREFTEQQRKEEERIRQRIVNLRKMHENKAINGKNSSVPQYQKYLDQDSNRFKVQVNMRQYQSRTHFDSKTPGQLCFHLKKTIIGSQTKNYEMQEQFKDYIRQPVAKQNRKRNTKTIDSGQLRLKKNPVQIIRGKGCSLYS